MVPVGERARVRMGGKIGLQPHHLRRIGSATFHQRRTVGVQRDYVPASQVVGVVSLARIAGQCPIVLEVACGAGRLVLVVARAGPGDGLESAPVRAVAVFVLGGGA
jgi:hypothetical protein